jgi:CelD/BcsL family acetyltransferase involved in cellulose biosynthesis
MVGTATAVIDAPAPTPAAALGACTIDVVTDEVAFLGLEAEWNATVDRAGLTHPFLRHEWIRTWWECFGSGGRLHIVLVRAGGRITAIAPLMAETVWMYGLPVRRLRLLHNEHTPRADFIVAERPDEMYRALWTALGQPSAGWDVLQLGQLPQQSPTGEAIRTLADADGCGIGVWRSGDAPYLELNGSWDQYFNGLTAKFRQNVRNRLSRLTRLGEPLLETLDETATILAAREDAFRLEASGWKHDAGTSVSADPAVHRFYSLLAERASTRGWLRLLFLSVNGRRIAVSYGSLYANRLFLFKTGYDPEYAQCSPFKLLTYFAVRGAFAGGLREVDFLGDAEPWKLDWTATTRPHDWLFVFGRSSRAALLRRAKFEILPALKRWRG